MVSILPILRPIMRPAMASISAPIGQVGENPGPGGGGQKIGLPLPNRSQFPGSVTFRVTGFVICGIGQGMNDDSNADPYCRMDPSPAKTTACFYCGGGLPWSKCGCRRAVEAQNGKRPRPKFIPASQSPNGRPILVLDEEALANGWLKLPRYERGGGTPVTKSEAASSPDVTKLALVSVDVTKSPPGVTEVVTKLPLSSAERKRRQRERDREKKARGE